MNAIILSVGDELVLGQTIDTNSAWISKKLSSVGCDILAHKTVPDDRTAIARAIREEASRCDVLIITGGIGPTEDDLTRDALADATGLPLELNEQWLEQLKTFFGKLGRTMPDRNRVQAMVPKGADILWNDRGTAPGLRLKWEKTVIFVMPGVPKEMFPMFERDVFPWISGQSGGAVILQKTLHTFGLGESTVAERLGKLMQRGRNPSVGTTVSGGIVSLRINARFESRQRAEQEMDQTIQACREALGSVIFGEDEQTLAQIVAGLLKEKGQTVTTAESCTGGLLAKMLTDISGSSQYFKQGWVTYTNQSKVKELGVTEQTLNTHGAVSEAVVYEMARGARCRSETDWAIAISGIAGPDGGTASKPVGTVCIGLDHSGGTWTRTFRFPGDREWIRDRSAKMALTILRYHLINETIPF